MIQFEIPGTPVGKGRPRFTKAGRTYTPAGTVHFENRAAFFAQIAMAGKPPLSGPIALDVWAYWPCPKSRHRKREPRPEEPRTSYPDADNVLKAVADALNGIAYQDDRQVTDAQIHKITAAQGEPPRTVVSVRSAT